MHFIGFVPLKNLDRHTIICAFLPTAKYMVLGIQRWKWEGRLLVITPSETTTQRSFASCPGSFIPYSIHAPSPQEKTIFLGVTTMIPMTWRMRWPLALWALHATESTGLKELIYWQEGLITNALQSLGYVGQVELRAHDTCVDHYFRNAWNFLVLLFMLSCNSSNSWTAAGTRKRQDNWGFGLWGNNGLGHSTK